MRLNNSKDKPIDPFGGALYENYNYAWTPPGELIVGPGIITDLLVKVECLSTPMYLGLQILV